MCQVFAMTGDTRWRLVTASARHATRTEPNAASEITALMSVE
jgi:hypothetical protein